MDLGVLQLSPEPFGHAGETHAVQFVDGWVDKAFFFSFFFGPARLWE